MGSGFRKDSHRCLTRHEQRLGGIILARMDSSRLPGKQLRLVRERPIMDWLLDRVARIEGLAEVVIATSERSVDDPLEQFAQERSIPCFRGSAFNVADRVLKCARERGYDAWARINGDSPLLDFTLFTHGIDLFRAGCDDVVTNALKRTYPVGNTVEIFDMQAFTEGYSRMTEDRHFEHLTLYFYEHPQAFRILNFTHPRGPQRVVSLAIDTPDDLERYIWMMDKVDGDHMKLIGDTAVDFALQFVNRSRQ